MDLTLLIQLDNVGSNIFSSFSLARLRLVSCAFNQTGRKVLDQGFKRTKQLYANLIHRIEHQLPLKDSLRHDHFLYSYVTGLTFISSDLEELDVSCYHHYDHKGLFCFIAGQCLDEALLLFRSFQVKLQAGVIVLREESYRKHRHLSDLVSAAKRHYNLYIRPKVPKLKAKLGYDQCSDDSVQAIINKYRKETTALTAVKHTDLGVRGNFITAYTNGSDEKLLDLQNRIQINSQRHEIKSLRSELSELKSFNERLGAALIACQRRIDRFEETSVLCPSCSRETETTEESRA